MRKKEQRFEAIYRQGNEFKKEGIVQIIVDKETGVHYLQNQMAYGVTLTPLLDSEGKVFIEK